MTPPPASASAAPQPSPAPSATPIRAAENAALIAAIDRVQALIQFDLSGQIQHANQHFLDAVGYTLSEVVGQHHRIFCEADYADSAEYREFWAELRRGSNHSGVYQRRRKDGQEVWLQASYNPVFDGNGKVESVIKFATDITQRRRAELEAAGKIAAIDRSQAVIEFRTNGEVLTANRNFLDLMGYTLDEVRGQHHRIFCPPDYVATRDYAKFWGTLARGEFHRGRFLRIGKFGQRVWIQATYNPILNPAGQVEKVVKFATDVTDQVEREEEIERRAQEIRGTMQKLCAATVTIADNAGHSNQLANATQQNARRGNQALEKLGVSMDEIQKASTGIREIVAVIAEIAGQTNLLAFNAAIEAARASESGAGFSVVADEVRRLAEKSAEATRRIEALSREAVARVNEGGVVSSEAVESFRAISEGVDDTNESIQQIESCTDEQTTLARHVAELVDRLLQGAHKSENAPVELGRCA
ncbi:methyl-accepting chemotaxis protein [Actomonas aquatica]|uniref:PAS domain-containing methyl-accepting chemotaxis protein n=1 Tax=Actomonas aquatica TaxID=2866162 RepID=A0ABZ1C671_9BACT|nr:PAS domain-containing methyl-accepting chemotaxis protein [Opitutus sp. WL0086]WRQ86971.1 PAS domain-containing methyl-accepting chemotaxis protein [Opitutus sp. WL0086]